MQLKCICVQTIRTNYNQLSFVTQKVMFAMKEKKYMNLDLDSSFWCWMGNDDYDDHYGGDLPLATLLFCVHFICMATKFIFV